MPTPPRRNARGWADYANASDGFSALSRRVSYPNNGPVSAEMEIPLRQFPWSRARRTGSSSSSSSSSRTPSMSSSGSTSGGTKETGPIRAKRTKKKTQRGSSIKIPRTLRNYNTPRRARLYADAGPHGRDTERDMFMSIPSSPRDDPFIAEHVMNYYGLLPETLLLEDIYDQPLDETYYTGSLRPGGVPAPPQHLLDARQKAYRLQGWGVHDEDRILAQRMRDAERAPIAEPFENVYSYSTHRRDTPQTAVEATGVIPDSIVRALSRRDGSRRTAFFDGVPLAELEVLGNFGSASRKRKTEPKSNTKPKAKAKPKAKPKAKTKSRKTV